MKENVDKALALVKSRRENIRPENIRKDIVIFNTKGQMSPLDGEEREGYPSERGYMIKPNELAGANGITKIKMKGIKNMQEQFLKPRYIKRGITLFGVEGTLDIFNPEIEENKIFIANKSDYYKILPQDNYDGFDEITVSVNVPPAEGQIMDTTDGTATEKDILFGKGAYVKGKGVNGILHTTNEIKKTASIENNQKEKKILFKTIQNKDEVLNDNGKIIQIAPYKNIAEKINITAKDIAPGQEVLGIVGDGAKFKLGEELNITVPATHENRYMPPFSIKYDKEKYEGYEHMNIYNPFSAPPIFPKPYAKVKFLENCAGPGLVALEQTPYLDLPNIEIQTLLDPNDYTDVEGAKKFFDACTILGVYPIYDNTVEGEDLLSLRIIVRGFKSNGVAGEGWYRVNELKYIYDNTSLKFIPINKENYYGTILIGDDRYQNTNESRIIQMLGGSNFEPFCFGMLMRNNDATYVVFFFDRYKGSPDNLEQHSIYDYIDRSNTDFSMDKFVKGEVGFQDKNVFLYLEDQKGKRGIFVDTINMDESEGQIWPAYTSLFDYVRIDPGILINDILQEKSKLLEKPPFRKMIKEGNLDFHNVPLLDSHIISALQYSRYFQGYKIYARKKGIEPFLEIKDTVNQENYYIDTSGKTITILEKIDPEKPAEVWIQKVKIHNKIFLDETHKTDGVYETELEYTITHPFFTKENDLNTNIFANDADEIDKIQCSRNLAYMIVTKANKDYLFKRIDFTLDNLEGGPMYGEGILYDSNNNILSKPIESLLSDGIILTAFEFMEKLPGSSFHFVEDSENMLIQGQDYKKIYYPVHRPPILFAKQLQKDTFLENDYIDGIGVIAQPYKEKEDGVVRILSMDSRLARENDY